MTEAVTTLLLVAHLVCVNIAVGGPLVCVWLEWRGDELALRAARSVGRWALATLTIGGVLGLALGCLMWDADYSALWLGPLRYKLVWGVAEFVFSLVLALAYWLLIRRRGPSSWPLRLVRGGIALLSGTNLLYHFPPLFVVTSQLHAAGSTTGAEIRGAAFRQLMVAGATPALVVHVGLASLAVTGAVLMWIGLRWQRKGDEVAGTNVAMWGGRWALAASLAQLPVGLWTLTALPPAVQTRLMGSDGVATVLFLGSMVVVLWLLRELAAVALGETTRGALARAIVAMLVAISLMTAMQRHLPVTAKAPAAGAPPSQETRS